MQQNNLQLLIMNNKYNIALLGGRGYVGQEIIAILNNHPNFILSKVFSKNAAGESIKEYTKLSNLEYSYLDEPEMIDLSDIDIAIMGSRHSSFTTWCSKSYEFRTNIRNSSRLGCRSRLE